MKAVRSGNGIIKHLFGLRLVQYCIYFVSSKNIGPGVADYFDSLKIVTPPVITNQRKLTPLES